MNKQYFLNIKYADKHLYLPEHRGTEDLDGNSVNSYSHNLFIREASRIRTFSTSLYRIQLR
jgi:hypothetical protein